LRNGFVFIYPYLRTLIKVCKGNRHELKVSLSSVLLIIKRINRVWAIE
jgi:hypothetical protein